MPSKSSILSGSLPALAKMVSNAGIQRIVFGDDFKSYGRQMKTLLRKNGLTLDRKYSLGEIVDHSYQHLLNNYRHEYLYKTALLNSYVLENFSLDDTVLLNEFKIGASKADIVLVNGTNKVFEIKTELDSPERLGTQLADYYKAFSEVYVVVHASQEKKYINLVSKKVGIMTFQDNKVKIARFAVSDQSKLEVTTMMKALRKDEYLDVVKSLTGIIPDVPPVLLFKSCLDALSEFSSVEVQSEFLKAIKNRINPSTNKLICNSEVPECFRLSCYYANLSNNDYISLIKKLAYQL